MTAVLTRRLLGLIVTLAMGVLPVVPAEHVHEVEEHGHVARHVHRHLQEHAVAVDHDALDHDDEAPARTLTQHYLVQTPTHPGAPAELVAVLLVPQPSTVHLAYAGFIERLIHGPPRGPTPDRGPPSPLAS